VFLRNVSLLEYDDVQQWMWQGPYSWQKGDFYTRTVAVRPSPCVDTITHSNLVGGC
jgi:hypothetical protein